jgi:hypothetical protein
MFKPIIDKLHLARISEPGVWLYSIQYEANGPLHYMYMQEESAQQLQQYINKVHPTDTKESWGPIGNTPG